MIRIFVGSDSHQRKAEIALEASILANTSAEVDIIFMRAGEGLLSDLKETPPRSKWPTPFTLFRMFVPEYAGFEGFAIYLDSDMLVLGDISELYNMRHAGKYVTTSVKKTEVAVIDCAEIGKRVPKIAVMLRLQTSMREMRMKLHASGHLVGTLPACWNHLDGFISSTKLVHFTNMWTQPWKPWPDHIDYKKHPDRNCVSLWEFWYQRGLENSSTARA